MRSACSLFKTIFRLMKNMAQLFWVIFLYFCQYCFIKGFLLPNEFRNVVDILETNNGGQFGTWRDEQYCARSTYAVGYRIKVQSSQGSDDDTALNGITLVCATVNGSFGGDITSGIGEFGTWHSPAYCPHDDPLNVEVMVQFRLKVEPDMGDDDDTSANDIDFQCWELHARLHTVPTASNINDQGGQLAGDTVHAPGGLANGNWVSSNRCPVNSAICGIQTRVEAFLSDRGDDSALNDVKFFCCQD